MPKKSILIILLTIFLTGCIYQKPMETKELTIKGQVIKVEVAKTNGQMSKGLSGRDSLCDNCGMLFEYEDYRIRSFWMKGMNFPLDIIWLRNNKVVGFQANVPILDEEGEIYRMKSEQEVNRVLEVKAGFIEASGLKIGDNLEGLD